MKRAPVTVGQQLHRAGVSRRAFLEFCTELMVAAPFGLALTEGITAESVAFCPGPVTLVIWLAFRTARLSRRSCGRRSPTCGT